MGRNISLPRWIGKSLTCWWKIYGGRVWNPAWNLHELKVEAGRGLSLASSPSG
jgi:hypothetical protein